MADNKQVVLSVDDEESVLESIQRSLNKLDAEVITATSGKAALEILQARKVDVILSDMRMPQMSGAEFLKAAAAQQPLSRRIMLTGAANAEDAISAINDGGVSRYLTKPWDDNELRRVVTDALRSVRLEEENQQLSILAQQQNEELRRLNVELEEQVSKRTEQLDHTSGLLENTLAEMELAYDQMIDLVANIATMPNAESESARGKSQLALIMGQELGLDEEELIHLNHAVRLHRLGWVGIPRSVTQTPLAQMSPEQRLQFEKHPVYAVAVLLSVPRLKQASNIIGAQHEAFNGDGFPSRSLGQGIPLAARILAVARDYFDAKSGRLFANQFTPSQAYELIVQGQHETYDPEVVAVFKSVIASVEELDVSLDEIPIKTMSLMPGMRLSRDLATSEGVVLLAKGITLAEDTIGTLLNLERRSDRNLQIFVVNDHDQEVAKSKAL